MCRNKYPWRITFDTNPDLCNLQCIMCEQHSEFAKKNMQNKIMPIGIIEKVLAETVSLGLKEIIPSTMGEPLLYKDFERIIELCRAYKIKLNLTTNGTFPRLGVKKWAELIVPITSDIKISWNGATKKTYESIMKGSNWEKTLQNVKNLIAIRNKHLEKAGDYCRITFQLTFLERNVNELPDMVKLAMDLGIDRIKGHHLWVNFNDMKDENMRRNSDSIKRWNESVRKTFEIAETYKLLGKNIIIENIFELKENANKELCLDSVCPFLGQEAWFNTKGEFSPCCAPNEQRKNLGNFGSVNEKKFSDIWESSQYMELVNNYRNNPLCKTCNMRKRI